MKTYYELLGVKENASSKEIKTAYKSLMKKYHPDVYEGDSTQAQKISAEINNAYDVLNNTQKRKEYDESLRAQRDEEAKRGYSYYNYSSSKTNTNYQRSNYRKESAADIYSRILRNKRGSKDNYSNSYSYRTISKAQDFVQNKLTSLSYRQLLLVVLAVVFICFIGLIFSLMDYNRLSKIKDNNTNTVKNKPSYNTYYYPPNNSINSNISNSLEEIMVYYGFDMFFDNEYEFQMFILQNDDLLKKYLNQEIDQTEYFEELYKRAEDSF